MKRKDFIVYPKTKIDPSDENIVIVDAPIKVKLKAFITGYIEDYNEPPSIERLQELFKISEQDANIALVLYRKEAPEL